jgi:hypothetical protein
VVVVVSLSCLEEQEMRTTWKMVVAAVVAAVQVLVAGLVLWEEVLVWHFHWRHGSLLLFGDVVSLSCLEEQEMTTTWKMVVAAVVAAVHWEEAEVSVWHLHWRHVSLLLFGEAV